MMWVAPSDDSLLQVVQAHPGETARQLADRVGQSDARLRVYKMLDRLAHDGCVAITRRSKAEGKTFALTVRGERVITQTLRHALAVVPLPIVSRTQPCGTPHCPTCKSRTGVSALAVDHAAIYYACRTCAETFCIGAIT